MCVQKSGHHSDTAFMRAAVGDLDCLKQLVESVGLSGGVLDAAVGSHLTCFSNATAGKSCIDEYY